MRWLVLALVIACHAAPSSPPPPDPAPPAGNSSTGSGSATADPTASAECPKERCGPVLGVMTKPCTDGSTSGPTGRCLEHADHTCGWEIHACP